MRQANEALHSGKTTQYVPVDGLYVYFRYTDDQVFMVVVNTSDKEVSTKAAKYDQFLKGKTRLTDALSNDENDVPLEFKVEPKSFSLYRIK